MKNTSEKKSSGSQHVSLFERVPDNKRLAWPDIAAILSGVVSSLSKLMGGGIVAFYAGAQFGSIAMVITFVLSLTLTYLVGKISFKEGLPNNVTSRFYIFGTKGSAVGSFVWIFLLVGVLAVGTVQLGNAVLYYFGWTSEIARYGLFFGISVLWIFASLFGVKIIARLNALFVFLLFAILFYVVYQLAAQGDLVNALTHGILIPNTDAIEGFSYAVNYAIMTSGLLALFAADFTRFAKKKRDIIPISLVGSLFAIITYLFGALITYFGFTKSVEYFTSLGYDQTSAAHAAITNPGVTLVVAVGFIGLLIICLSQMKVETSNSIGGANAVSNLFDSLFGIKIKWPVAVVIANVIGLVFILGGILDQINAFMSYGSILAISWCILLITDYYIVRGPLKIGSRGIISLTHIEKVNWRGVSTIIIVTLSNSILYATGLVAVPFLTVAPMTMILYIVLSIVMKKRVVEADRVMRAAEQEADQA